MALEWSNKTIFAILAVTLLITVAGTAINLSKIYRFNGGLTGAASTSAIGSSTVTISQSTSITDDFGLIQFGTGFVNASCTVCVMDSNGIITQACCGTFNTSNNRGFLLENTGNVNLSVNYTCAGNCTAALFIGGTSPVFSIRTMNNSFAGQTGEVSTADTNPACFNLLNLTQYTAVSAAGAWLCGNNSIYPLDFTDSQDAIVVDLNVSVPVDAPTGSQKNASFTFNAQATG